jgi:dGTPase
VVAASEGHVFHNRLTHTLKVAQVARRLAEMLVRPWDEATTHPEPRPAIDADVVEAAALAHDLGHPPYGHVAETQLHTLMRGAGRPVTATEAAEADGVTVYDGNDGFEGNAQSFRIITKLALSNLSFRGLDLTTATLAATLKYPWLHDGDSPHSRAFKKWGAYRSEQDDFRFALRLGPETPLPTPENGNRSLEADIMDWADDIAYAVHDAEDFYRAGLLPLDRLAESHSQRAEFADWVRRRWQAQGKNPAATVEDLAAATDVIRTLFGSRAPYDGSSEQRIAVRNFVSALVARYVLATQLVFQEGVHSLRIDPAYKLEVDVLKELTWRYVIERPSLASQQEGQVRTVRDLFEIFVDAMEGRKNRAILPQRALQLLDGAEDTPLLRGRTACDLICSLTEQEASRLHRRLTGLEIGSVIDPLLPG